MSRTLKGTRARGLPPKVLLSQRQDATGSFPTKWRTSSDNRTGKYPVFFNDDKVIQFNQKITNADAYIHTHSEYEEKVFTVSVLSNLETVFFTTSFSGTPIVVITELSSSSGLQGVNAFLTQTVSSYFTVNFSAPFAGTFVYRAMYDSATGTPRIVKRSPRYENLYAETVVQQVIPATNHFDVSFSSFSYIPEENFITLYDADGNKEADISSNITKISRTSIAVTSSEYASIYVQYMGQSGQSNMPLGMSGLSYPLGLTTQNDTSILAPESFSDLYKIPYLSGGVLHNQPIFASGSMVKGIADSFVTFTPGQDIQAFRDSGNPAVDGKISSSINGANTFYATGSAVDVTGQGFQQPLWSKSKVEIDLTPASAQTISLNNTGSTGNYPMSYWNPNAKQYEGIGTGRGLWSGFGNTAPSNTAAIQALLENQIYGFGASIDTGSPTYGITPEKTNVYGRQISTFGFPYHIKFQPTSSQQIEMNKYISEPFLLEKIVLELSGTFQTEHPLYGTDSAIWTFFVLNSRNFVPNKLSDPKTINIKVAGGARSSFATSSFVGSSYLDLLDYFQVAYTGSFLSDDIFAINRELIVTPTELSTPLRYIYNNQMAISSSVKSSLKYDGSGFYATRNSANTVLLTSQSLNISGRNQIFNANGRDWRTTFESATLNGTTISSQPGTLDSIEVNVFYTKPNPYILLPTDKITLGFQLPWSATMGFANYGVTSSIGFATTGINKITLYGSSLRVNPETNQLEEHHDTLNQLLSSNSICETIGD